MTVRGRIATPFYAMHQDMTIWRRDIHAHPELGFQESRTSDIVAAKLKAWGIECTGAWPRPASWASFARASSGTSA